MPNWERRQADTLADAIAKHCRNNPGLVNVNSQLMAIQKAVDDSATTISTTAGDLASQRSHVCFICRSCKLYECDVPHGWSDNCALIYANASEFSPL